MLRIAEIQEALLHLVGWDQSFDPSLKIYPDLTQSESGLYYQGVHPLLTLRNIKATMPDELYFRYPPYESDKTYSTGDIVMYNMSVWEALSEVKGIPPKNGENWKPYDLLSEYLYKQTRNGIAAVVQNFIQLKQLNDETKTLLNRIVLFDGSGRINDYITNTGKICGFEIVPVRSMGVTTKIEKIGLQMYGASGTVRIYIFHSSMIEPYRVFDLDVTGGKGTFQWFPIDDLYLPYIGDNGAGGSWYVVYNQNELPYDMEAINVSKDWSKEPCGSCNQGNAQVWREMTKYIQISPFKIAAPENFSENPELWDISRNIWTNTTSYGLNLQLSVGCDLTDFIISQRQLFQSVLAKQVAVNMLRMMAMNPDVRVNREQLNVDRQDILYEIDGNTQGRVSGLGEELRKAYEALKINTQGLDRICLKCNNHGVKYTTC